jgi:PGF-CTERM protein
VLDGAGHTIDGLTINRSAEDRVGLIGVLDDEGTVRNVSVADADITGNLYTGGLVGTSDGTVVSSSATGTVTSSSNNAGGLAGSNDGLLTESSAQVTVTGDAQIGGLVGLNSGIVGESYATGFVNASGSRAGGLVATNADNATVSRSYATGNVTGNSKIGGLAGLNLGTIEQTVAVGSVSGSSDIGGVVGNDTASFADTPGTVEDSYFDEQATGQSTSAGNVISLTTTQMTGESARTNMSGFNFNTTWKTTDSYPELRTFSDTSGQDGDDGSGGEDTESVQVDVDSDDLPGSGTEADPYQISNASELQAIEDDLDANYTLVTDIDASNTMQWNNGSGFDPVGDDESESSTPDPFTGSLDGNGYTVTQLTINRSTESHVGLIGSTGSGALINDISVKNITVSGSNDVGGLVGNNDESDGTIQNAAVIGTVNSSSFVAGGLVGNNDGTIQNATATVTVTGPRQVGGLVGENGGPIQNVRATGNVTGFGTGEVGGLVGENDGPIQNVRATGDVSGSDEVGGLVGINDELIRNATATGTVDGSSTQVGGLVGENGFAVIRNVTATGDVSGSDEVGGLVGANDDVIRNATATGDVNGSKEVGGLVGRSGGMIRRAKATGNVTGSDEKVGGLVGENDDGLIRDTFAVGSVSVTGTGSVGGLVAVQSSGGNIQDSYWDNQTTGQPTSDGANATELTTAQMTGQAAETNMTGLDFDSVWQTQPDDYPVLRSETSDEDDDGGDGNDLAGDGTKTDPYVITNASELQAMEDDLEAYYELGNDIDASNTTQWNNRKGFDPIGGDSVESSTPDPFNGSLDGSGYTVTKLTINRSNKDKVGLIGQSDSGAVVSNISIKNVTLSGSDDVGGLAGDNRGTIQNVRVTGNVTGLNGVGGIVGTNPFGGQIQNATAAVTVTSTSSSFGGAGGLVGSNDGPIQDVRATGNVTGSADQSGGLVGRNSGDDAEIRNATATGRITGNNESGGLVGANVNGEIQNATATGTVTGSNLVGGLVGENDEASIRNATAAGDVSGSDYVGGLAGANTDNSSIRRTKATGSVTGSNNVSALAGANLDDASIRDTFAVGSVSVTGGSNVGGLVAVQSSGGSIQDSYWDEQGTGQAASAGSATGLTTAQMTGEAARTNMSGLNFESVWSTTESYPELRAFSDTSGQNGDQDAAPVIFAPPDGAYDPNFPLTIGTGHNATGVINSSDVAVRLVNVTDGNNTVVAVNDSVPVQGGVNTTIPASSLAGNVTIETQLYNNSSQSVVATDILNLTAVSDSDQDAAPVIFAPPDGAYDPNTPFTIGTGHNATGVINSSDVAIRLVNVTDGTNTVVAVNDSAPVEGSVNTTIPAENLAGNVTIETQLYNNSSQTVVATDVLNLTAVSDNDQDVAPAIFAPQDVTYDPTTPFTIGTGHNATGVVNGSDVAIRLVNVTDGNDTVVAVNDSAPVQGSVNTTIPAGTLSGNVTIQTQLYNNSSKRAVANDTVDLIAESSGDGGTSDPEPIQVDIDPSDLDGDGSKSNPYEISNASELQAMEDDLDANYELVEDINASSTAQWNSGKGFDPVGGSEFSPGNPDPFSGSLDGNNHTIKGVTIDRSNEGLVGLFGVNSGTITDISLTKHTVTGGKNGDDNIGGLAGTNVGTITNAKVSGNIDGRDVVGGLVGANGGTISNATASGSVNGSIVVGGLVGMHYEGTITDATASGSVNGSDNIGGLVGENSATIRDTFAVGTVTQTAEDNLADGGTNIGGLVGAGATGQVKDSYFDDEATDQTTSGGNATGLATSQMQGTAAVSNMSALDFNTTWKTTESYPELRPFSDTSGQDGENESSGEDNESVQVDVDPGDLPGDGTESDPYQISNASELQAMEDDLDGNYTLVSDINASNTAQWNNGSGFDPVGGALFNNDVPWFSGTLNGSGHSVTGLTINRPSEDFVGIFGTNSGTVSNISLMNITINGNSRVGIVGAANSGIIIDTRVSGNINGDRYVAGVVGENDGTISNTTVSINVSAGQDVGGLVGGNRGTIKTARASGTVNGTGVVGGLAGSNGGTISIARASSRVTGSEFGSIGGLVGRNGGTITAATASGNVTGIGEGGDDVGGLVGENTGTITNTAAYGRVSASDNVGGLVGRNDGGGNREGGTIREALAVGSVSGESSVGGLVGSNVAFDGTTGSVFASYFDSQATGQTTFADNVTNLTTVEMQGQAARTNMSELDFESIWETTSGYPELRERPEIDDGSTDTRPTVDTDASFVQPVTATAESTQEYRVSIDIGNISDNTAGGEVDVELEGFNVASDSDSTDSTDPDGTDANEVTVNYTAANVTDSTLEVSANVSATAPATTGVYEVTVTDLRQEDGSETAFLIEDANIPIGSIDVNELDTDDPDGPDGGGGGGDSGTASPTVAFGETTSLETGQLEPDNLSGKIRAETGNDENISVELLRSSQQNYSVAITGPEDAENVTFYLQARAISSSQNIEEGNLNVFVNGSRQTFNITEQSNSPWVGFVIPHFSTQVVTFTSGTELSNASVSDTVIQSGESVTVNATLENTGSESTTVTLNLTDNGTQIDNKTVTVASGEKRAVNFTPTLTETRDHELNISGLSAGTVEVTESESDPITSDPTETETSSEAPGFGPVVTLAALLSMMLLALRRTST